MLTSIRAVKCNGILLFSAAGKPNNPLHSVAPCTDHRFMEKSPNRTESTELNRNKGPKVIQFRSSTNRTESSYLPGATESN